MKNETKFIKICNVYMNNKIISENIFEIRKDVTEEEIFKVFALISSVIDIRIGQAKDQCSRTTLQIIDIKQY